MRPLFRNLVMGCAGTVVAVGLLVFLNRITQQPPVGAAEEPASPTLTQDSPLPDNTQMTKLAQDDPIGFLENCLRRYQRQVKGFSCVLQKQERIDKKLQPVEVCEVCFKDKPHSVYFQWLEGARKAERALFVDGDYNNKMLARPKGPLIRKLVGDVVERDVDGPEAKQSGRSTLNRFGLKKATERTLTVWKTAKEKGNLPVKYLGEELCKEAGDRMCWKFRFTPENPQDKDFSELTLFFDKENWLQIGSIVKDEDGKLTGEYYFRGVKVNPEFKEDQFKREALIP